MQRSIILLAGVLILFAIVLLFFDYRNAYEILPVQPSEQLNEEIDDGWQDFEDQETGFHAQFPTKPQVAVENLQLLNELRLYRAYVSETPQGQVFMVTFVTFSESSYKTGNDGLMRRFINELAEGVEGNRLEKMEPSQFDGFPAYDFTIENNLNTMEGLVFMDDKKLVLISELNPKNLTTSEFSKFKDAFKYNHQ